MPQLKNRMIIALMDEYVRAVKDYLLILSKMTTEDFTEIRDKETKDPDCHSIQTITTHIVSSGYTYANYVRSLVGGEWNEYKQKIETPPQAITEIDKMMNYTNDSFEGLWEKTNDELSEFSIKARWGVTFTFEQLMEHAIVHILRHRRQVENFLGNCIN